MARLTEAQMRAPKSGGLKGTKSSGPSALTVASIVLLLAIVPLAVSMRWSEYLITGLDMWLKPAHEPEANADEGVEERLSSEEILEACKAHQYTSEIISLDPLVIYINNFTSAHEAEELIDIGSPDFESSYISRSHGPNSLVSGRTSTSAPLPLSHPLVDCILTRARTFMGSMLLPTEPFSIPQLVRYFPGQKYDLHTDFWPDHQVVNDGPDRGRLFNRVASFFVFLRDNCTDGYTNFPSVSPPSAEPADLAARYGDKVAVGEKDGQPQGIKFKPVRGNAVFWVNIDGEGKGDRRLVHAGLPVGEGEKIGLNIWPRKWYGWEDGRVEEGERKVKWSGKWKE